MWIVVPSQNTTKIKQKNIWSEDVNIYCVVSCKGDDCKDNMNAQNKACGAEASVPSQL